MKLLLLTDYSELSAFMRNIADKIATKTGWEVHVLNVVNIPSEITKVDHETIDMSCASDPLIYVEQRNHSIEKMEAFTQNMNSHHHTHVFYGGILDTIEEVVKEKDIDLIAMGTFYSRGLKNFFNNTLLESIVKSIDVPVLSLKCNRDQAVFKDMLLYCDFEYPFEYDFEIMCSIRKAFDSRLHLIHMSSSEAENKVILERMNQFAQKYQLNPEFVELVQASSKEEAVLKYVEDFEKSGKGSIELIGVQKRLRKEFGKYFLGSKAAKFVNKIERPILTVTSFKEQK